MRSTVTFKFDKEIGGLFELKKMLRMFDRAFNLVIEVDGKRYNNFILTNEYENEDTICIKVGEEEKNEEI